MIRYSLGGGAGVCAGGKFDQIASVLSHRKWGILAAPAEQDSS